MTVLHRYAKLWHALEPGPGRVATIADRLQTEPPEVALAVYRGLAEQTCDDELELREAAFACSTRLSIKDQIESALALARCLRWEDAHDREREVIAWVWALRGQLPADAHETFLRLTLAAALSWRNVDEAACEAALRAGLTRPVQDSTLSLHIQVCCRLAEALLPDGRDEAASWLERVDRHLAANEVESSGHADAFLALADACDAFTALATAQEDAGELTDATGWLERALAVAEREVVDHHQSIDLLNRVAALHTRAGKTADAARCLQERDRAVSRAAGQIVPFFRQVRGPQPRDVGLLSADQIMALSFGDVATSDDLTSPRIFGPSRDLECSCGKYTGRASYGTVCESCGVEVLWATTRRYRLGHITLATPVVHPFYLQFVAHFLNESEDAVVDRVRDGASVVRDQLEAIDMYEWRDPLNASSRDHNALVYTEAFFDEGIQPVRCVLTHLPVLPPDIDLSAFPTSPAREAVMMAYARIIDANTEGQAQALCEAVEHLFSLLGSSAHAAAAVGDDEADDTAGADDHRGDVATATVPERDAYLLTDWIPVKGVIGQLSSTCVEALQSAVVHAMNADHYEVTTAHMLLALLDDPASECSHLAKSLDRVNRVERACQEALQHLRHGNPGKPTFSPRMLDWFIDASSVGTLRYGIDRVSSGVLFALAVTAPGRYEPRLENERMHLDEVLAAAAQHVGHEAQDAT